MFPSINTSIRSTSRPAAATHCAQPEHEPQGGCWNNAVAESFFSTLEWELLRKSSFATQSYTQRARSELINHLFNGFRTSPAALPLVRNLEGRHAWIQGVPLAAISPE